MTQLRVIVVGAGAWGLPAAAELAHRGHRVTLLDRHGVGNLLSSSSGPTRLWRLSHPDAVRVRLAQRSVAAMDRLAARSGADIRLRRGLLWRDAENRPAGGEGPAPGRGPPPARRPPGAGPVFSPPPAPPPPAG